MLSLSPSTQVHSYGCSAAHPSWAGYRNNEVPLTSQSTSPIEISVYVSKEQMKVFQNIRDAKSCELPLTWRLDSVYHSAVHIWVKRGTKGGWFTEARSKKEYKLKDKFWHNGEPVAQLQMTLGSLARLTSPCSPPSSLDVFPPLRTNRAQ